MVVRARDGSKGLIDILQRTFATYETPDEISLFEALNLLLISPDHSYLHGVGIHYRVRSVIFPHSNCRAEVTDKTVWTQR